MVDRADAPKLNGGPLAGRRFGRPVMRAVSSASASNPRSASLTASEVGNALVSFGSIKATEVPFVTSLKNLPRSNFPKSERLYSARISPSAFFINYPFRACDTPCTDDPNAARAVAMRNRQQPPKTRHAERYVTGLAVRMVRVMTRHSKLIKKYRSGLVERYAMLLEIGRGFWRIPLELHHRVALSPLRITRSQPACATVHGARPRAAQRWVAPGHSMT